MTGPIPSELGQISGLRNIDIGTNNFDGTIPTELGNIAAMEILGIGKHRVHHDVHVRNKCRPFPSNCRKYWIDDFIT